MNITSSIELPNTREIWFTSINLNASFSNEFFKLEYQGDNLSKVVPMNHMIEGFDKMLRVIQI